MRSMLLLLGVTVLLLAAGRLEVAARPVIEMPGLPAPDMGQDPDVDSKLTEAMDTEAQYQGEVVMGQPQKEESEKSDQVFAPMEIVSDPVTDERESLHDDDPHLMATGITERSSLLEAAANVPVSSPGANPHKVEELEEGPTNTTEADEKKDEDVKKEEKLIWGMSVVLFSILIIVVIIAIILIVVLIWWLLRLKKKRALKAAGQNTEVKSVTPITTPDGQHAAIVNVQPLSEGGSASAGGN